MNRRNVLAGIGALTAGGGAIFGSGAFSQVEATRTVSLDIAGDSEALMALNVDSSIRTETDGEVGIDLENPDNGNSNVDNASGLNQNAVTTFEAALAITNQGADTVDLDVPSEIEIANSSNVSVTNTTDESLSGSKIGIGFELDTDYSSEDGDFGSPAADSSNYVSDDGSLATGDTAVYNLVINLVGSDLTSNDNPLDIDVTIAANSN